MYFQISRYKHVINCREMSREIKKRKNEISREKRFHSALIEDRKRVLREELRKIRQIKSKIQI